MRPLKVDLPNCSHLYEPSNKIHAWFRLEQAIAQGEARIKMLEAEIEAERKAVQEHKKQIHSLRMEAISATDPVQQYLDKKDE